VGASAAQAVRPIEARAARSERQILSCFIVRNPGWGEPGSPWCLVTPGKKAMDMPATANAGIARCGNEFAHCVPGARVSCFAVCDASQLWRTFHVTRVPRKVTRVTC
jgi:hypothetical protein